MSTKRPGFSMAHWILAARSFVVIFGCVAIWWGVVEFPVFWRESSTERIANQIIGGAPFKSEILGRQFPFIDGIETSAYCRPVTLRSAAIIRLRMAEIAISANDPHQIDQHLKSLGAGIRSSLSCSPANPFLWVVLFWIENTQKGADPTYLKHLRMSYELGPNEGWIALKRNPIALAFFPALPPDLAEAAVSEFVALVRSHLYSEAIDIIAGPARSIRDLLFARLKDINEADRKAFANLLYDRGFDDISIPGIVPPPQYPWH
jgi:hypothetical protein